jgi:hypothetical protein
MKMETTEDQIEKNRLEQQDIFKRFGFSLDAETGVSRNFENKKHGHQVGPSKSELEHLGPGCSYF